MITPEETRRELARAVEQSIAVKSRLMAECADEIVGITDAITSALLSGRKLLLCGNGGSAADAQHVAGEFVGRYLAERRPLPAIALTPDSSVHTCIGNDYSFEDVFARQVEALANPGDVVVGISTSGNSKNVLRAIEAGRKRGAVTIGFTGAGGGKLQGAVDLCLRIPSQVTARIQEAHITVWHVICEMVDRAVLSEPAVREAAIQAAA